MSGDESVPLRRAFDEAAIRSITRDHDRITALEKKLHEMEVAQAGRRMPTMEQLANRFVTHEQFKPFATAGAAIAKLVMAAVVGGILSLVILK